MNDCMFCIYCLKAEFYEQHALIHRNSNAFFVIGWWSHESQSDLITCATSTTWTHMGDKSFVFTGDYLIFISDEINNKWNICKKKKPQYNASSMWTFYIFYFFILHSFYIYTILCSQNVYYLNFIVKLTYLELEGHKLWNQCLGIRSAATVISFLLTCFSDY